MSDTNEESKTTLDEQNNTKNNKIFIIEAAIAVIAIAAIAIAIIFGNKKAGNDEYCHTLVFADTCINSGEATTSISVNTKYGEPPVVPDCVSMNAITEEEAMALVESGQLIKLTATNGTPVYVVNYKSDDFKNAIKITDEEIDQFIDQNITVQFATQQPITGRDTVMKGDTININYVGTVDGIQFEGGTGNFDLPIGSGSFIPGFEDQLIGAKVGESVSVNVTFPDPYVNNPDLSGKDAVFAVSVNELLYTIEYPELSDDLVATFFAGEGMTDINTVEKCKEFFRDYLGSGLIDQEIYKAFYVTSVDADTVAAFYNDNTNLYDLMAESYQKPLEALLLENGMDIATFLQENMNDAVSQAMYFQCIDALANELGVQVTDEDIDTFVKLQGCQTVEEIKEMYGKEDSLIYHVKQYKLSKTLANL